MKNSLYRLLLTLLALISAQSAIGQETPPITLTLLGEQQLETGTLYEDTEVGGLSGITYDADRDVYYAISDDRSALGPARFYTLSLDISETAFSGLTITDTTPILQEDGTEFALNSVDPEAIRYIQATDSLLWSSESDAEEMPFVREMDLDGTFISEYVLPAYYLPDVEMGVGVRSNNAFEAVALSPDEQLVYIGTESALQQDGDISTLESGSPSRLLIYDRIMGNVAAEYIYEVGPIPVSADPPTTTQDNGLVALLPYNETQLVAIERSFVLGVGNTIAIYLVDFTEATNIAGESSIAELDFTPVAKTHLLTLEEGTFGLDVDNIEGATWGPTVNEQQTLVLVSDNNFNAPAQMYTQFIVLLVGS